jgi:hypothetical protein
VRRKRERVGVPGPPAAAAGFSCVELLLALALGLMVSAVVIQALDGASRGGERLILLLRERQISRRTLALLRGELGMAQSWRFGAEAGLGAECQLGGRAAVLGLELEGRRITYSVGIPPSKIWRGLVLMRCGPAYGLSGELSGGLAQNRVLVDGLVTNGFQVDLASPGVARLGLEQAFFNRRGARLPLRTEILANISEK